MWIETEDGAVNLDYVKQIIVAPEGNEFKLHFALEDGWGISAGIYYDREEAVQQVHELTERQDNPLRVVSSGESHEEEDTQASSP